MMVNSSIFNVWSTNLTVLSGVTAESDDSNRKVAENKQVSLTEITRHLSISNMGKITNKKVMHFLPVSWLL
jgi:hypothetical protein